MLVFGGVYRWSIEDWLVVSNIVYFHPYLRKWWKLTHIFQMGWNHQPDRGWSANKDVCMFLFCLQKKERIDSKRWWWFQIFIPTWGDDPIWLIFFNWVWNHQLEKVRITAISNCYLSKDQLFDALVFNSVLEFRGQQIDIMEGPWRSLMSCFLPLRYDICRYRHRYQTWQVSDFKTS